MRLLEALARRLARARDADAYVLRGGMAIRAWVPGRVARDVDVVCRLPYRVRDLTARLAELLAIPASDGVVFDDELRVDPWAPESPRRGLQVFARARVDGVLAELTADLTFGLEVWPHARRDDIGGTRSWACPPSMVIATKLAVLDELGPRAWRTKDLADLWHLLRRFAPDRALGEALERTGARALLTQPWWHHPDTAMRWARHVATHPEVPHDLAGVLAELRSHLAPFTRHA